MYDIVTIQINEQFNSLINEHGKQFNKPQLKTLVK